MLGFGIKTHIEIMHRKWSSTCAGITVNVGNANKVNRSVHMKE
jgi:hypothetical protein